MHIVLTTFNIPTIKAVNSDITHPWARNTLTRTTSYSSTILKPWFNGVIFGKWKIIGFYFWEYHLKGDSWYKEISIWHCHCHCWMHPIHVVGQFDIDTSFISSCTSFSMRNHPTKVPIQYSITNTDCKFYTQKANHWKSTITEPFH